MFEDNVKICPNQIGHLETNPQRPNSILIAWKMIGAWQKCMWSENNALAMLFYLKSMYFCFIIQMPSCNKSTKDAHLKVLQFIEEQGKCRHQYKGIQNVYPSSVVVIVEVTTGWGKLKDKARSVGTISFMNSYHTYSHTWCIYQALSTDYMECYRVLHFHYMVCPVTENLITYKASLYLCGMTAVYQELYSLCCITALYRWLIN